MAFSLNSDRGRLRPFQFDMKLMHFYSISPLPSFMVSASRQKLVGYCWWFRNPANQLIGIHPRWCRISSINSNIPPFTFMIFRLQWKRWCWSNLSSLFTWNREFCHWHLWCFPQIQKNCQKHRHFQESDPMEILWVAEQPKMAGLWDILHRINELSKFRSPPANQLAQCQASFKEMPAFSSKMEDACSVYMHV